MKTTKLFFMAALALMTAACSNDDNDLTTQQPQKAEGITITAQLAPKTNGATTRAVEDKTTYIETKWAVNEQIAILYEVGSTKYVAEATITAVDGSGTATITFTVDGGTKNDTPCTLVYPLSAAKDDHTGVKDVATLLAAQNGTLNANLDVRVGEGTIQTTTPGLTVTTQPAAQFAIFKFTTKNAAGTATINVKPLTITTGGQDYVITPASATSTLYAALPAVSGQTVSFSATGSDSKTYICSKASVTFDAGKYYQSTLKMAEAGPTAYTLAESTVGMIVGSDGQAYAAADKDNLSTGVTVAGLVAYKNGDNGLAIALTDEPNTMDWDVAMGNSGAKAHTPAVTGQTWKLPSYDDIEKMLSNYDSYWPDLNAAIVNVGGTGLLGGAENSYWLSDVSDEDENEARYMNDLSDEPKWVSKGESYLVRSVIAF